MSIVVIGTTFVDIKGYPFGKYIRMAEMPDILNI